MIESIPELRELLARITIEEIISKIEFYRKLNFKTIEDQKLFEEIANVLMIGNGIHKKAILFRRTPSYPEGTKFYRVRKLSAEDHYLPLKDMSFEKDAWNPPEECITKPGRLNKIKESLLYTSPIYPSVAVDEMKIQENERFCLIVYEAKEEVKISIIGQWVKLAELNKGENLKMRIISNFLNDEFSRDVGQGTEYLYRASERIAKDYFDLPPRVVQDAWCYPSIASKPHCNVCFRPALAKELLKLVGIQICKVKKENSDYIFKPIGILADFDKDDKFIFHEIGSAKCSELFPEIQTI